MSDGDALAVAATERSTPWRPHDFITRRAFCPISDIQRRLDEVRAATGSTEVLLVSFDRQWILRTLTMLSADAPSHPLIAMLRRRRGGPLPRTRRSNPLWAPIDNESLTKRLETLADDVDRVPGADPDAFLLVRDMHELSPWKLLSNFTPDPSLAVNTLILVRGGHVDDATADRVGEELTVMVNATVNASNHRDVQISALIHRALRPDGMSVQQDPFAQLLNLACKVSRSQAAVIFELDLASQERPWLVERSLVTESDSLRPAESRLPANDFMPVQVATAAFMRGQPQILLHAANTVDGRAPTFEYDGSPVPHEIAIPIPSGWGNGTTYGYGVLVLCRKEDDLGPYGDYDLALLRNVALRIALVRSSLQLAEAGAGVVETSRHIAFAEPSQIDKVPWGDLASEISVEIEAERDQVRKLPIDLALAVEQCGPVLDFVARLTGSHSATLRFLLPSVASEGTATGRSYELHRVVSWPAWRGAEEPRVIDLDVDGFVNAWVARTGQEVYLPTLRDSRATARAVPGLKEAFLVGGRESLSELCVPVNVDGRLVGTLNLEAPRAYAYELLEPVVRASAAQVSLIIAGVRRNFLRDVLSISSDVQNSTHDLAKVLRKLQEQPDGGELVDYASGELKRIVNLLERPSEGGVERGESPSAISIRSLLSEASERIGVRLDFENQVDVECSWSVRTTRRIFLALCEMAANYQAHRRLNDASMRVAVGSIDVGGRRYCELTFRNVIRPGDDPDPVRLYRAPITKDDGLHPGAYIAGAILRTLGGEVMSLNLDELSELAVMVSIPTGESP